MEFRRATVEDIEILVERRMEMRAEREISLCPIDLGDFRASTRDYFLRHIPDESFIAWVALNEGAMVATSGLCVHNIPPTYGNTSGRVAYLVNMYTVPEYRSQGIAAKLLEHLMDEARNLKCGRVTLNTSKTARPLYEKYGFVDVPDEMEYFIE
ncbi:MAG: GNAT family N-acetyltransferase [Thermoplasmata archaeon]|nr:GNAT family N-acetyltransferase [Thermoplasmata archaeon]